MMRCLRIGKLSAQIVAFLLVSFFFNLAFSETERQVIRQLFHTLRKCQKCHVYSASARAYPLSVLFEVAAQSLGATSRVLGRVEPAPPLGAQQLGLPARRERKLWLATGKTQAARARRERSDARGRVLSYGFTAVSRVTWPGA